MWNVKWKVDSNLKGDSMQKKNINYLFIVSRNNESTAIIFLSFLASYSCNLKVIMHTYICV